MQHFTSLEELHLNETWGTIGAFDGVHRGHQALIQQLVSSAHNEQKPAVVVTFYPHPVVVLRKIATPFYLTSSEERAALLGELGVDYVVTLPFSFELSILSAHQFMQMLVEHLGLRKLFTGHDFALGHNREGNVERLRNIGEELGYEIEVVPPLDFGGEVVSSSRIRTLISKGEVQQAARLLGRLYSLSGQVVHGDGRGHGLGVPTSNLEVQPQRILPANGVYACWAIVNDQRIPAVTNVGLRPTFEDQPLQPRVETHLLDFQGQLYGQMIKLQFISRIRPEKRFSAVDELLDQIRKDIQIAREVLANAE
ncbi:MAG: bifunctional riboflavin kinase/FAD synthetase [Anaerolineales bacterium]